MNLDYSVSHLTSHQIPVLKISGEIDIHTAPEFKKILDEVITMENRQSHMILDLEDVQYIDSTGLGTIAACLAQLEHAKAHLYLISTRPSIQKILEFSGLTKKNLKVFNSEAEVLAKLS